MGVKDKRTLPTLKKGINILRTDMEGLEALHSMVINQILLFGGEAAWIDTGSMCSTHLMSGLSPTENLLDRITVARAFTPYQHFSLVEKLPEMINRDTELLVVPLANLLYSEDVLNRREGRRLFLRAMEKIGRTAKQHSISVLMTEDPFRELRLPFRNGKELRCKKTKMGVRFESENFQTLTYTGPGYIQTTLMLWELLLKQTYRIKKKEVIGNGKNEPNIQKRVKAS